LPSSASRSSSRRSCRFSALAFLTPPAPPDLYTLSLHDALPICPYLVQPFPDRRRRERARVRYRRFDLDPIARLACRPHNADGMTDRKSTRLNSSHVKISYAVFCLKKKKRLHKHRRTRHSTRGGH